MALDRRVGISAATRIVSATDSGESPYPFSTDLWPRMAAESPGAITFASSHRTGESRRPWTRA